jgi:hypothetical protein
MIVDEFIGIAERLANVALYEAFAVKVDLICVA